MERLIQDTDSKFEIIFLTLSLVSSVAISAFWASSHCWMAFDNVASSTVNGVRADTSMYLKKKAGKYTEMRLVEVCQVVLLIIINLLDIFVFFLCGLLGQIDSSTMRLAQIQY